MQSPSLAGLRNWKEWQQSDEGLRLFPTHYSLLWFIRQHEAELIESGAMLKMRNQWHFVMPIFEQTVLEILRHHTPRAQSHV